MNISTGGPHILLFERDQQLTALLISEFQLAGYKCHTARTAVEVFDAIARQPIRLVLVNLSQAAAARREFWVALDTQRRGRGVQVLTFHCTNIGNYGPRDPDEHAPTMVDLEVDGMAGIMGLVDAVRARLSGGENTAPPAQRVIRSTSSGLTSAQRPIAQPAGNNLPFANGGSGINAQENTPTLLSSYNNMQNAPMPTLNELVAGDMQSRAAFTGQAIGNGGAQPLYPQGNISTGNIPPSPPFYAQNATNPSSMAVPPSPFTQSSINPGGVSAPPPLYTQSQSAMAMPPSPFAQGTGGIAAQPAQYVQNAANPGVAPAQQSFAQNAGMSPQQSLYTQNTANPNAIPTQASPYVQRTNGTGALPVQPSPFAQNGGGTGAMPIQASPYMQNPMNQGAMPAQASPYMQNANSSGTIPIQQSPYAQNDDGSGNGQAQPSYTEKIRAVLYPNQKTWGPQGTAAPSFAPENRNAYEPPANMPAPPPMPSQPVPASDQSASTVLQRLASGQAGDGQRESSLAQLSRMVQESNHFMLENTSNTPAYQVSQAPQVPKTPPVQEVPSNNRQPGQFFQSSSNNSPRIQEVVQPEPRNENFGASTLRASPIQDLPMERSVGNPVSNDNPKRPDVLSRTNYAQQPAAPLASLSAATQTEGERRKTERAGIEDNQQIAPVARTAQEPTARAIKGRVSTEPARMIKAKVIPEPPHSEPIQEPPPLPNKGVQDNMQTVTIQEIDPSTIPRIYPTEQIIPTRTKGNPPLAFDEGIQAPEQNRSQETARTDDYTETDNNKRLLEKAQEEIKAALGQHASLDTSNAPSSALLLDIMQSLPPMPAPSQQIQAQVLNGRATRSLGSVLLEGHLVPESRLEVAQNVQRMLRGVDLNYQLGEILLMFKLLTPDQLLAASLVSYGMITTTQISALGRIRQELHSIGLEYDLENLVIMFRILTPEQLREVRANWQ
jgi:hypothetical protein